MQSKKNNFINVFSPYLEEFFLNSYLDLEDNFLSISNNNLIMSSAMHIPDHISGTGHAKLLEPNLQQFEYGSSGVTNSMMRVPEKIIFGKDGALYGFTEPPIDGISYNEYEYENNRINLQELPSKLTANEYVEGDLNETTYENRSVTSIAIEENAIKELKLLKRQLARLAVRVYEIEDELEKRKSRDWHSYAMSFVGIAALIASLMMLSNKNSRIF